MQFKKTFKIVDTGYQRNIYYYVDGKRVSSDNYYDKEVLCQVKGMKYKSAWSYTLPNGRTMQSHCYD